MAQISIGKDLPNLKITLGNDFKPEDLIEEGELSDSDQNMTASCDPVVGNEKTVEIHRQFISPLESFRKYENRGGAFITGLDLSLEALSKKLEERAARFGLEDRPQKPITQAEIDALYESLEISTEKNKFPASKSKNIRLDAIHMRGVEEMSTNDVFEYFKEYGPASVEWINDYSCNVVWLDETSAARALLGLSRVLVIQKKKLPSSSDPISKNPEDEDVTGQADQTMKEDSKGAQMEEVIVMSDLGSDDDSSSDDDDDDGDKHVEFKHRKSEEVEKMEVDETLNLTEDEDKQEKEKLHDSQVDVPMPPGHWRIGIPHAKAKAILLRFASKDDKKLPGAEKRSQYYRKYGNPNYGGLKGLISTTRKRKIMATRKKVGVQQLSATTAEIGEKLKPNDLEKFMPYHAKKSKRLRMRMRADDEEEKIVKRLENIQRNKLIHRAMEDKIPRKVHDRLGKRTEELRYENSEAAYVSTSEDEDNEERYRNVRSTISKPSSRKNMPARYNVWTRLAESMAQESEEDDSDRLAPKKRTERKFISSSSRDLRNKLHLSSSQSSRKASDSSDDRTDLRSKLEAIRKSGKPSNHRSPLIIEIQNRNSD